MVEQRPDRPVSTIFPAYITTTSSPQLATALIDLGGRHGQKTHDRARGHALAATAFADQTDDATGLDRQRQMIDDRRHAVLAPKPDRQIIDRQQRCLGHLGYPTALHCYANTTLGK